MFKLGGHRPDPIKVYPTFNKSILEEPLFSGDIDLRPYSSPRHNQRNINCCVAESVIKALEIKRIQKYGHTAHVDLSVMDLYYGARDEMDPKETHKDEGTHIYLACDVLKKFGVCREEMNPFNEKNVFIPTPILATRESYMNKISAAYKINSTGKERIEDILANLMVGNPVVFGTVVGQSWFDYGPNSKPLSKIKFEDVKGSHATCLLGYVKGNFIIENSWGNWGQDGFAEILPEVIMDDNSRDFWTIAIGSEINK